MHDQVSGASSCSLEDDVHLTQAHLSDVQLHIGAVRKTSLEFDGVEVEEMFPVLSCCEQPRFSCTSDVFLHSQLLSDGVRIRLPRSTTMLEIVEYGASTDVLGLLGQTGVDEVDQRTDSTPDKSSECTILPSSSGCIGLNACIHFVDATLRDIHIIYPQQCLSYAETYSSEFHQSCIDDHTLGVSLADAQPISYDLSCDNESLIAVEICLHDQFEASGHQEKAQISVEDFRTDECLVLSECEKRSGSNDDSAVQWHIHNVSDELELLYPITIQVQDFVSTPGEGILDRIYRDRIIDYGSLVSENRRATGEAQDFDKDSSDKDVFGRIKIGDVCQIKGRIQCTVPRVEAEPTILATEVAETDSKSAQSVAFVEAIQKEEDLLETQSVSANPPGELTSLVQTPPTSQASDDDVLKVLPRESVLGHDEAALELQHHPSGRQKSHLLAKQIFEAAVVQSFEIDLQPLLTFHKLSTKVFMKPRPPQTKVKDAEAAGSLSAENLPRDEVLEEPTGSSARPVVRRLQKIYPDGRVVEQVTTRELQFSTSPGSLSPSGLDKIISALPSPPETSPRAEDRPISLSNFKVYTDTVEGEPHVERRIQEVSETLPDGRVIKRKVVRIRQRRTVIKHIVTEGPEVEEAVYGSAQESADGGGESFDDVRVLRDDAPEGPVSTDHEHVDNQVGQLAQSTASAVSFCVGAEDSISRRTTCDLNSESKVAGQEGLPCDTADSTITEGATSLALSLHHLSIDAATHPFDEVGWGITSDASSNSYVGYSETGIQSSIWYRTSL